MKKLIIGMGIAAMVMGMASMASASATDWLIYLKASDQNGSNALNSQCLYGTKTGALDIADGNDIPSSAGGSSVALGSFDLGAGAGQTGYNKELRAPGTALSTWNLKLWVQDSAPISVTQIKLTFWNPTGTYGIDPTKSYTLSVVGDPTKTFTFDGKTFGTTSAPQGTWLFDAATYKGYANALSLQLAPAAAVPEPGSMVAMLSGLAGLVGFGIRRRK